MDIEKIAHELARLMKGANDDDAGNFAHHFDDEVYGDCSPTWIAICDRAAELIPTIKLTREERARWSRANREFNACARYEAQQLGYGA